MNVGKVRGEKTGTQIFGGLMVAIGLWTVGVLLSGRFSLVEENVFANMGFISLLFIPLFAAAMILAANYSAEKGKRAFFYSFVAFSSVQTVGAELCLLGSLLADVDIPFISAIVREIVAVLYIVTTPGLSLSLTVVERVLDGLGVDSYWYYAAIVVAVMLPMILSTVWAVKIYRDKE